VLDAVLLDIDGVLTISWAAIDGAVEALSWLREHGVAFRLVTNTTTHTREDLAKQLEDAGLDVAPDEIVTAVLATAAYLRSRYGRPRCYVLSDGDPEADFEGIDLVPLEDADVVVIGGAGPEFTYEAIDAIFRRLLDGVALVAMHRNMYWRTSEGLRLDAGAYVAGLEEAAGVRATICGKPSPAYFTAALSSLDVDVGRAAMVGDDVVNDVLAAQNVGMTGVLVRTGKFRDEDVRRGRVDHVIDSIADLPALIGASNG
jgi:HAD superfamily hydrolase (TIGR01458 family)